LFTVFSLASFPCPQNCNGNGYCNQTLQRCICNRTYFDHDCSIQAQEILPDLNETSIPPQSNFYFFADNLGTHTRDTSFFANILIEPEESFKVLFNKSEGFVRFYFLLNKKDTFSLPNPSHKISFKELHYDQNGSYIILTNHFLSHFEEGTFLMNVYNYDTRDVNVTIMTETYSIEISTKSKSLNNLIAEGNANRDTLMRTMIGVSGFLIIVWSAVTLIKCNFFYLYLNESF